MWDRRREGGRSRGITVPHGTKLCNGAWRLCLGQTELTQSSSNTDSDVSRRLMSEINHPVYVCLHMQIVYLCALSLVCPLMRSLALSKLESHTLKGLLWLHEHQHFRLVNNKQPIVIVSELVCYISHDDNVAFASLDPVPEVPPMITLSQKDTVILRRGERFEITCSSANVNPDFSVKWDFPSTAVRLMKGLSGFSSAFVSGWLTVRMWNFLCFYLADWPGHLSIQERARYLHWS